MASEKLFVVIPAYNEGKRIAKVIRKARRYCENVVVVDDGSSDNTSEVAEKEKAVVLRHIINIGKGAALKTGCDYAVKQKADKIIVMDADGQHDPALIPLFVKVLRNNDIVFGCRKFNKKMPLIFRFGNSFINKVQEILFNIRISDTQSGYRAFTADAYKKIRWDAIDYSMESEMIANVSKNNLKYIEIPITTIYAEKYKGTTIIDGIKIVLKMIWWRVAK